MKNGRLPIVLWLFIFLLGSCKQDRIIDSLPRSVPEAEGVSSAEILEFLRAAGNSRNEFHSFIFLRHGKVIAEGWWNPYSPELKHTLYSTSKSFTAAAVGFAVSENKLSVNDKVISFFPDELPDTVSPFLADMTVKDLLTMTAGQDPDPTFIVATRDSNWVKAFLAVPVIRDPGTVFLYNSLATYMLSAIIQKVTGEMMVGYLTPRLFQPLGISGMDWETNPQGINTGGWGLRLKTEDMAKFGLLYLQKGLWNSRQILPASWVEEATTAWIDQAPEASRSRKDSSDWMQGYCYQMWRCRHDGFRADGAYGQYIIVMPGLDAVIAITCESQDMQEEINLVWDYLLPSIKGDRLPENSSQAAKLKEKLASLRLDPPVKGIMPPLAAEISGKEYEMVPNSMHLDKLRFRFGEDRCEVTMKIDAVDYSYSFGAGKWVPGETSRKGPNLLLQAKGHFEGLPHARITGAFGWKDGNTLELVLRYIESPHTETITCGMNGNSIRVNFRYSNMSGMEPVQLTGMIAE